MRRFIVCWLAIGTAMTMVTTDSLAQQASTAPSSAAGTARLSKLPVPATRAKEIATQLSLRYRDVPGVTISPDPQNDQLVVMAPDEARSQIADDVRELVDTSVRPAMAAEEGPVQMRLTRVTWREFEDSLQQIAGKDLPVTTSRNGERASFQLGQGMLKGTVVEVDRRADVVTVVAPAGKQASWERLIEAIDRQPDGKRDVTELIRVEKAEPAPIQRAIRLLRDLDQEQADGVQASARHAKPVFRNAAFQPPNGNPQEQPADPSQPADQNQPAELNQADDQDRPGDAPQGGAGIIGELDIQFVEDLGVIIVRGAERDVERVRSLIDEIEQQSELTRPQIEVKRLKHTDSNAVAGLLEELYEDVLSARQGDVSITPLDTPNAILLIGREEAIKTVLELVQKLDQPIDDADRLRVFRLQHASALDAEERVRDFFTDRPGSEDDVRPGIGIRVRVLADYRTNSLIVSGSPRDMAEVTRMVNELDVEQISAKNEIKIFKLSNARAEDLQPTIQDAITGGDDVTTSDDFTPPSTTLSIVTVDADGDRTLDSGILTGVTVTADENSNALVVRGPASSMPLIAELIRQLDRAPGIDSLVKVFTVQHGDASQLTTTLQDLFGAEAGTQGTQVGAGNLPAASASESTLVPLRFTTDIRSNSIIASGSASDLDVVESILLRLDGDGFAERITEVIWLRHQIAEFVATAIQQYVTQRQQGRNQILQYQQGLGPYDLPDRDLIVVAEERTNSLILSVSPRIYEEVRRLIDHLDRRPPMVLIKTLIVEVNLDDAFEVGGELGLQDSLLFDRGIALDSNRGFNFNRTGTPNENGFGRESLASRGLSTFGVGTTSGTSGFGGLVLNAANESISLLFRTLQESGRLQVISRPQVMVLDNNDGLVSVGRQIARITDVVNTIQGIQVVTEDIPVGLILRVTPRVGSDGLIVMNIDATRSDRDTANGTVVPTGEGSVVIDDIIETTAQSTISAFSGQTVVFGGLIQKTRSNSSRRIPYLADIPYLGHMFKFDREVETRSELLIIMTPTLVTGEQDLEYIKETESSRMSWCLADVTEAHGDVGLSGGYGLWGPAVGPTIYPDLQPTVDDVINGHQMKRRDSILYGEPGEELPGPIVPAEPYGSGVEAIQGDGADGPPAEGFPAPQTPLPDPSAWNGEPTRAAPLTSGPDETPDVQTDEHTARRGSESQQWSMIVQQGLDVRPKSSPSRLGYVTPASASEPMPNSPASARASRIDRATGPRASTAAEPTISPRSWIR